MVLHRKCNNPSPSFQGYRWAVFEIIGPQNSLQFDVKKWSRIPEVLNWSFSISRLLFWKMKSFEASKKVNCKRKDFFFLFTQWLKITEKVSFLQLCERSELRFIYKWFGSRIWAWYGAKIQIWDIFGYFQTLWAKNYEVHQPQETLIGCDFLYVVPVAFEAKEEGREVFNNGFLTLGWSTITINVVGLYYDEEIEQLPHWYACYMYYAGSPWLLVSPLEAAMLQLLLSLKVEPAVRTSEGMLKKIHFSFFDGLFSILFSQTVPARRSFTWQCFLFFLLIKHHLLSKTAKMQ